MNKKFLSVILFSALMVGTAGTFVSCKDYDDDIENLQKQIDENAKAIDQINKLISDGSVITGVVGKSSVSCPLKPSDSAPLKHSTMPP